MGYGTLYHTVLYMHGSEVPYTPKYHTCKVSSGTQTQVLLKQICLDQRYHKGI